MGAVLLMLLALVLPVAPAAASSEGTEDEGAVTAAHLTPFVFDDCNPSLNGQARFFVTLKSSSGTDIPATNGGPAATVTLIGVGTQNANQTVQMPVGDLEGQAFTGVDTNTDGDCLDQGDTPAAQPDGHANDYGSPYVNATLPVGGGGAGAGTFQWQLLISAPGHQSQLITSVQFLGDGMPAGNGFGGTGCLRTDRGCLISLGTITLTALTVSTAGRGTISGAVTDVTGLPLAGVEVVIFRQPDQDPTNDIGGAIFEGTAASVLTDATGQYVVTNLAPGRYSVTVADTRFPLPCQPNANCGIQPATKQVNLLVFDPTTGAQITNTTANFAVPTDVQTKQAPGQTVPTGQVGVFGYVADGSSGARIGVGAPGFAGFIPTGISPAPGTITFTPTGSNVGNFTTVTATPDASGRYQAVLVGGISYIVAINLPNGYVGACTAGGNANNVVAPPNPANTPLFPCQVNATQPAPGNVVLPPGTQGTSQVTFPVAANGNVPAIVAPTTGVWNDGLTFVLVPSAATVQPFPGQTTVRRLDAVVPGIYRNPDTSYTGVDVETVQVRVVNNGTLRTGAQIEWWTTSSDDIPSLIKTDTLDLNPGAVGIFARSIIPDGCTRCHAEVYTTDLDVVPFNNPYGTFTPAPNVNGNVYGLSDLQVTVSHRVVDAGNALAGGNGMTYEDLIPTGQSVNQGYVIPVVYKNYGGGAHKWNSIVSGCLTRGVPGAQPIVFEFWATGETRGGPYNVTRSTNPGGCLVINLGLFDPNDPDYYDPIAGLPDGTYSVYITSTAGLPVPQPPEKPGGFFASALNYTVTGRMAVLSNGAPPLGNEACPPIINPSGGSAGQLLNCQVNTGAAIPVAPANPAFRELYGPLVFKRYNDWNSGVAVVNFRSRFATQTGFAGGGGGGSGVSIAMYGEDGTLFGVYLDRLGDLTGRIFYLPTLPIQLPDGFRGTSIISIGDNTASTRTGANVTSVNYERNQAISYNYVRQDQLTAPASPFTRPCNAPVQSTTDAFTPVAPPPGQQFTDCLFVPDAQRRFGGAPRGSAATFEVGLGPTTGVRFFNPDVNKLGLPAYLVATYIDAAGVIWTDSFTALNVPAYGTATIFMGADARLPDIFDGSMYVQTTQPLAAIGNVVDYRVTDHDASYAYNIPNKSGMTN
jgi:hypothetical protein